MTKLGSYISSDSKGSPVYNKRLPTEGTSEEEWASTRREMCTKYIGHSSPTAVSCAIQIKALKKFFLWAGYSLYGDKHKRQKVDF